MQCRPPPTKIPPKNPFYPADFPTYVHTSTQPWERALLSHLQWTIPPFQVMTFIHQMSATDSLLLVSDGSSFESKSMSFGLALGSSSGTSLVENQGPTFGRPSSHRAECNGCLSGALLLHHLQQFTKITTPITAPVVAIISVSVRMDTMDETSLPRHLWYEVMVSRSLSR